MCQNGIFYETSVTDALIYAYQTNDTSKIFFFLTGILYIYIYIYIYIERERERERERDCGWQSTECGAVGKDAQAM